MHDGYAEALVVDGGRDVVRTIDERGLGAQCLDIASWLVMRTLVVCDMAR